MHRMIVNEHLSRIGSIKTGNQAKKRRFAAAGRAQQNPELPDIASFPRVGIFDLKINVLQRVHLPAIRRAERLCHAADGDLVFSSFHASPLSGARSQWKRRLRCPQMWRRPVAMERGASPERSG